MISDTIKSVPYANGYMTLRALNANTQIDTSNICVKTPLGIYQITKFLVKGLSIVTASRTVTEHDITRRVESTNGTLYQKQAITQIQEDYM